MGRRRCLVRFILDSDFLDFLGRNRGLLLSGLNNTVARSLQQCCLGRATVLFFSGGGGGRSEQLAVSSWQMAGRDGDVNHRGHRGTEGGLGDSGCWLLTSGFWA